MPRNLRGRHRGSAIDRSKSVRSSSYYQGAANGDAQCNTRCQFRVPRSPRKLASETSTFSRVFNAVHYVKTVNFSLGSWLCVRSSPSTASRLGSALPSHSCRSCCAAVEGESAFLPFAVRRRRASLRTVQAELGACH